MAFILSSIIRGMERVAILRRPWKSPRHFIINLMELDAIHMFSIIMADSDQSTTSRCLVIGYLEVYYAPIQKVHNAWSITRFRKELILTITRTGIPWAANRCKLSMRKFRGILLVDSPREVRSERQKSIMLLVQTNLVISRDLQLARIRVLGSRMYQISVGYA